MLYLCVSNGKAKLTIKKLQWFNTTELQISSQELWNQSLHTWHIAIFVCCLAMAINRDIYWMKTWTVSTTTCNYTSTSACTCTYTCTCSCTCMYMCDSAVTQNSIHVSTCVSTNLIIHDNVSYSFVVAWFINYWSWAHAYTCTCTCMLQ